MKLFLISFFKNIKTIFSKRNLFWHLLAAVFTYLIVISGIDWKVFLFACSFSKKIFFFPALFLGIFMPFFLPLGLLFWGWLYKKRKVFRVGMFLFEAVLLGIFITSFYKAFTGRIQPPIHSHLEKTACINLSDTSHDFQFGFLRHGIFWGWPSGHTTVAFAMATMLAVFFRRKKLLRFSVMAYAVYIGLSVVITSIHWFSEMIAGVIIGQLIGVIVGKNFLKKEQIEK